MEQKLGYALKHIPFADLTETFTSTDAKGGKLRRRRSSWDESDADNSPRHTTLVSKKKSSRRKTSIEPTTENEAKGICY